MSIHVVDTSDWVLMEGAVIERLKRLPQGALHPELLNAPLIYDDAGRNLMTGIFREYIQKGREADHPIMTASPTWRAGRDNVADSALAKSDLNGDAVRFMKEIRGLEGEYADRMLIGGLMACRGDAYKSEEALEETEAANYHAWQAEALASAGPDYLMAATLPALSEAKGMAAALAGTGLPYIISFVVRSTGTLLDGTPIDTAIDAIDQGIDPKPWLYMINCVHPGHVAEALAKMPKKTLQRLKGLQGNTAALTPEELDASTDTISDPPDVWATSMVRLHRDFGLKILGGCCGSDDRHIGALAEMMKREC